MIEEHKEKLNKANSNTSSEEIYRNYKEQRKNTLDFAIVHKEIEEKLCKNLKESIKNLTFQF